MSVSNTTLDKIIDQVLLKIDNLNTLKEEFLKSQLNHLYLPDESLTLIERGLDQFLCLQIQHKYWLAIQAVLIWSKGYDQNLETTQARFHDLLNRMEVEVSRGFKTDPAYCSNPITRRLAELNPRAQQEVLEHARRLQNKLILQQGN